VESRLFVTPHGDHRTIPSHGTHAVGIEVGLGSRKSPGEDASSEGRSSLPLRHILSKLISSFSLFVKPIDRLWLENDL